MATIAESIQNIEQLQQNLIVIFQETITENEEYIKKLQQRQLDKGVDIFDLKLQHAYKTYPVYSKGYEKKKRKAGKYRGVVDLNFQGDYRKGITVEFENPETAILQAPEAVVNGFNLSEGLRKWYGYFEGLTKDHLDSTIDYLKSIFLKKCRDILKL